MVGCSYEDVDKIYIIFISENTGKCTLLLIMYGGMTSIFWSSMSFLHSIVIKSPARGDFTMAEEKKLNSLQNISCLIKVFVSQSMQLCLQHYKIFLSADRKCLFMNCFCIEFHSGKVSLGFFFTLILI